MEVSFGGPSPEDDRRVAVHEAGHTTVALLLFPELVEFVTIEPGWVDRGPGREREAYAGIHHMRLPKDEEVDQFTDDHWRNLLALGYGGFLAEELVLGKMGADFLSDLNTTSGIIQLLHARRPPARGFLAKLRRAVWDPNPEHDLAMKRVKQLLLEHRTLVEAIADALITHRVLHHERLLELLAAHHAAI